MTDKKTLKKLKRMDAFQEKFFAGGKWLSSHSRAMILIMLPLALVALLLASWRYFQIKQGESRRDALALIDEKFEKEETEAQTKRQAIMTEIENLEKTSTSAQDPAQSQKIQSKRKDMQAIKPDHSATLESFLSYYKSNSSNAEGWRAGLMASRIFINTKKFSEAAELLGKIIASADGLEFYQTQVRTLYISVLEELKQFDTAFAEVEKLLQAVNTTAKPKALLTKGKLLVVAGKKEEANKTFSQILNEHSGTEEARRARAFLAL